MILDNIEFQMEKGLLFIIAVLIMIGIGYFTFKLITCKIKKHYYKQFSAEQRRIKQYKKIKAQKERAYQNTVNNFINNRITEDIDNNNSLLSSSAKRLVSMYKET